MLAEIVGFVLVQTVAMGLGYKRGRTQGILSSGKQMQKAANIKFRKHMEELRKNYPHF